LNVRTSIGSFENGSDFITSEEFLEQSDVYWLLDKTPL